MKQIYEGWTKVNEKETIEDLESYIFNQLVTKAGVEVIIGTDASLRTDMGKNKKLKFLTVIVFRHQAIPCTNHVIMRRDEEVKIGKVPTSVKLNGEVNRTAELALWFRDKINIDPEIHLDLNPDANAGSFQVYKYIHGYFESLGFKAEYKPAGTAYCASSVADYFL